MTARKDWRAWPISVTVARWHNSRRKSSTLVRSKFIG
nr:MAG TPA: hypothetical protein [Caudoviricetes sp.]